MFDVLTYIAFIAFALKYHSMGDAVMELGSAAEIREVFVGFQEHLDVPLAVV